MDDLPASQSIPTDTIENDVVEVIDRTALIENIINQIIVDYCDPRTDVREFMWSVVLDTSVMSLGAKLKVISAISHQVEFKLNRDALYKVISHRNAFAHHASDAFPVLRVSHRPEDMTQYNLLTILEGSGKLSHIARHKALAQFNTAYGVARSSLVELKAAIAKVRGEA